MKTLFISDLHLSETSPHLTQLFLHALSYCTEEVDALYILGDFFAAWVGDDASNTDFVHTVCDALQALKTRGIKVYLMRGNRDFLLGEAFCEAAGCTLIADPTVITLYGKQILLTHGDTLNTDDRLYLRYRGVVQHSWVKYAFLCLPLSLREAVARALRQNSRKRQRLPQQRRYDTISTTQQFAVLDQYGVDEMIHGHTHLPSLQLLNLHGKLRQCTVLGDWGKLGNILIYTDTGSKRLCDFSLKDSALYSSVD